ncbi:hypothetical protein AruPA_19710 [Acidiphilium sp. PA]|uniref:hypothetical protein n=1 Tax=Acidiphilium sp. PA TaxID=2871705 RepID=UPI0022443D9A|nr:hypothetical protein [Acidiphilium sp. PA]MCW8309263.1 hypothetical protein [Acidiphilium sp. PA]
MNFQTSGYTTVARDAEGPEHLFLTMVEAREINAPSGSSLLLWRLLAALQVANADEALASR